MEIRPIRPEECDRLGAITLYAYTRLDGHVAEPDYETELADVAGRSTAHGATVFVAVDDDGTVLGGITYVGAKDSELAEFVDPEAAGIRMLAVDHAAQGRGIGEALTRVCIDQARRDGKRAIELHSTPWMATAHRLYGRLGFVREPSLDWTPEPGIDLMGFRLDLPPP